MGRIPLLPPSSARQEIAALGNTSWLGDNRPTAGNAAPYTADQLHSQNDILANPQSLCLPVNGEKLDQLPIHCDADPQPAFCHLNHSSETVDANSFLHPDSSAQQAPLGCSYAPSSSLPIGHLYGQPDCLSGVNSDVMDPLDWLMNDLPEPQQRVADINWMSDIDMMAMWSSAPTGLQCVFPLLWALALPLNPFSD